MSTTTSIRAEVEEVLATEVRPALSAHVGDIELVAVTERRIDLRMRRSCGACYFRRGCAANLVRPALEERLGSGIEFRIR